MNKYLFTVIVSLMLLYICFIDGVQRDFFVEGGFLLISLYSLFMLNTNDKQPFSLFKIFFLFSFFFYGIAPWLQFKEKIFFWTTMPIKFESYILTNLYVFLFLIAFTLTYNYKKVRIKRNVAINKKINNSKWNPFTIILSFVISVLSFVLVYYFNDSNIYNLLFRGSDMNTASLGEQTASLIVNSFIRPIPLIIFILYCYSAKTNLFLKIIFGLLFLITVFPTSLARLSIAAYYIPVVMLLFPIIRKKNYLIVTIILGLLILFPLFGQFRDYNIGTEIRILDFDSFIREDFDAYHNFAQAVQANFITFGRQLLGVCLFFVPRSIWIDKPIGTGHQIADELGFIFPNISATFPLEGYANFGIFGIVLFAILLALLCKYSDYKYWEGANNSSLFNVNYLFMIGMLFFILRGDLLSGTAYTIGLLLSCYFINKVIIGLNKLSI